jgi:hypothetical protein
LFWRNVGLEMNGGVKKILSEDQSTWLSFAKDQLEGGGPWVLVMIVLAYQVPAILKEIFCHIRESRKVSARLGEKRKGLSGRSQESRSARSNRKGSGK